MGWYELYVDSIRKREAQERDAKCLAEDRGLTFTKEGSESYYICDAQRDSLRIYSGMLIHCLCYLEGWIASDTVRNLRPGPIKR